MTTGSKTIVQKKSSSRFEIVLVSLTIGFAILAFLASQNPYFGFDLLISRQLQLLPARGVGDFLMFITYLGYVIPGSLLLLSGAILLVKLKKKLDALIMVISTIGAVALSSLFKLIISRPRPDSLIIHQLTALPGDSSFPSGHVLFFIGLIGYLLYLVHLYFPKGIIKIIFGTTLFILILLMGISRIYVGAHWFSDTLGAYIIGSAWLFLVIKIRPFLIDNLSQKSQ